MTTGRRTLDDIEDAIRDIRQRERGVQTELETATQQRAKLIGLRANAFRELAQVRAKSALADGVIDQADRLSHRVASLLEARQKTINSLTERLDVTSKDYEDRLAQSETVHADLKVLEDELDAIAGRARDMLLNDDGYREIKTKYEILQSVRGEAMKKAEQSRTDRERKGRDYERDPLFMYLWNRGYRTNRYKANRFIRWADDLVAKLVGYTNARSDYAVLLEIPQRLFEHVAKLDKKLSAQRMKLEEMEAFETRELAGRDFISKLDDARTRELELDKDIEALGAEIAEISTQLNQYAEGIDPSFKKAVELSAGFLEQKSYRQLLKLARTTTEPTDDDIVERIADFDRKRDSLRDDVERGRQELDKLAERREELVRVAADFRRSHYDVPGSVFIPDGSVQVILEELIKGAITGAEYWARAQRRHHWNSRTADPFRRSNGFPPFGGSDFGRSWRGGGGFRSGGGF